METYLKGVLAFATVSTLSHQNNLGMKIRYLFEEKNMQKFQL